MMCVCVCVSLVTGPRLLRVLGRDVMLEKTCGSIADCTFEELCGRVSVQKFSLQIFICLIVNILKNDGLKSSTITVNAAGHIQLNC